MTVRVYPFARGDGQNVDEANWRTMFGWWQMGYGIVPQSPDGVGTALDVSDASDTVFYKVVVQPGVAWLNGHIFENDAPVEITLESILGASSDAWLIYAYIDLVTASGGFATAKQTTASVQAIAPVTRDSTRLEIPLAYAVPSGGNLTIHDRRWATTGTYRFVRDISTAYTAGSANEIQFNTQNMGNAAVDLPASGIPILEGGIYDLTARLDVATANVHFMSYIRVERGSQTYYDTTAVYKGQDANAARLSLNVSLSLRRGDYVYLRFVPYNVGATIDYAALVLTRIR